MSKETPYYPPFPIRHRFSYSWFGRIWLMVLTGGAGLVTLFFAFAFISTLSIPWLFFTGFFLYLTSFFLARSWLHTSEILLNEEFIAIRDISGHQTTLPLQAIDQVREYGFWGILTFGSRQQPHIIRVSDEIKDYEKLVDLLFKSRPDLWQIPYHRYLIPNLWIVLLCYSVPAGMAIVGAMVVPSQSPGGFLMLASGLLLLLFFLYSAPLVVKLTPDSLTIIYALKWTRLSHAQFRSVEIMEDRGSYKVRLYTNKNEIYDLGSFWTGNSMAFCYIKSWHYQFLARKQEYVNRGYLNDFPVN